MTSAPRISAVMPVYNGAHLVAQSLAPLLSMQARGEIVEVIVVDDGSTDETAARATSLGAQVVASGGRLGPGGARNCAAALARGDILWFVDADVVVHDDAARVLAAAFVDPAVAAVFGSYDDRPCAPGFLSQYKNLLHHFHHQRLAGAVATFWAGCGAVRREAFLECGGFDAVRFARPSIEDIDLGWRLAARGARIDAVPTLQGTHLKAWSLKELVVTDVLRRALPWSRLIMQGRAAAGILNVSRAERARALLALAAFASVFAAALRLASPWWCALLLVATIAANPALFAFFRRRRGFAFAVGALLVHQVYYVYSSLVFGWCWLTRGAGADANVSLDAPSRSSTSR